MPVYKNKDNGTWYVMTQYTDYFEQNGGYECLPIL